MGIYCKIVNELIIKLISLANRLKRLESLGIIKIPSTIVQAHYYSFIIFDSTMYNLSNMSRILQEAD